MTAVWLLSETGSEGKPLVTLAAPSRTSAVAAAAIARFVREVCLPLHSCGLAPSTSSSGSSRQSPGPQLGNAVAQKKPHEKERPQRRGDQLKLMVDNADMDY
jgi:hypothetical protein